MQPNSRKIQKPMKVHAVWMAFFMVILWNGSQARMSEQSNSVAQEEKELAKMALDILNHDSTEFKIELNKEFIGRLTALLERPESYDHPFKEMETVSRLAPDDDSFRIFTWYLVDKQAGAYYAEDAHYYFGLVQRKHIDPSGKEHILVIPLLEIDRLPRNFEQVVTDNYAWFGSLYYGAKFGSSIAAYDGYYYKLVPKDGGVEEDENEKELVVTFTPGKVQGRMLKESNKLTYRNHERVKESVRYYTLMGWNGWDNKGNYKVLEIMSFDPEDSSRVIFGAPIIYFDQIPKARALFKYSDFGHFTMNTGYVKWGLFNLFRKKMVVYDHLAPPEYARPTDKWELGPDGSYDALTYYPKYGGYFEWHRDVEIADDFENKQHKKEMQALQMEYAAQDSATFPDYGELMRGRAARKQRKRQRKVLKQQQKAAERRLRESGIEFD